MDIKLNKSRRFENGWTVKEAYRHYRNWKEEAEGKDWPGKDISFWEWLKGLVVIRP